MKRTAPRTKLSTTGSGNTHRYLQSPVKSGRARTIAEAVDWVAERVQRFEKRARLERDTAAYFAGSDAGVQKEEARLEQALSDSVDEVSWQEALDRAVAERLERIRRRRNKAALIKRLHKIGQECAALPVLDKRRPEEMLYDRHGIPK